ncbi:MAG: OmpA family protein [Deltaproteobacteria bacterium]|nr:OmpA family protein [Deltaproteobacteria bacterium]
MKNGFFLVFLASSAALAVGCNSPGMSSRAKDPGAAAKKAAVGQTETTSAAVPLKELEGPGLQTANLSISETITKTCGIAPRADGKTSPSFEYDSAALGEDDRRLLAEVAKCLTEGPLRGKGVTLVGRADPRGEPEYNFTLGGSRADTVHRYLVDLGVGRDRLVATSRGELDATGKDEAGWAKDRRVDVELTK